MTQRGRRAIHLILGAGSGSAAALLLSYCAFQLDFNLPTAGFVCLLIVVLSALKFGFWEATVSSFVAVACLDYFFAPPIFDFHIADPENWVALASFEITALIVSRLSIQVQDQTRQAVLQRRNTAKLYEFSRSILVLDRHIPAGPKISSLIEKHIASHPCPNRAVSRCVAQVHAKGRKDASDQHEHCPRYHSDSLCLFGFTSGKELTR
jgi:two-component system, OmpR family, sensor histidine kinase KdpD